MFPEPPERGCILCKAEARIRFNRQLMYLFLLNLISNCVVMTDNLYVQAHSLIFFLILFIHSTNSELPPCSWCSEWWQWKLKCIGQCTMGLNIILQLIMKFAKQFTMLYVGFLIYPHNNHTGNKITVPVFTVEETKAKNMICPMSPNGWVMELGFGGRVCSLHCHSILSPLVFSGVHGPVGEKYV